jgi:hypothetical protein
MLASHETKYSNKIDGDKGNYQQQVRFDLTGLKYLGITQFDGETVKDRVLLSPKQVDELRAFLGRPKK